MNKYEAMSFIAVCIMMGVFLFGVTQCTKEETKHKPSYEKNNYQKCLEGCPKNWAYEFDNYECPIMCAQTTIGDYNENTSNRNK